MFTALPVESDVLSIKNNLSEIADSGAVAQTESQKNLGLGIHLCSLHGRHIE
ncbi:Uncharacterised protein [Serratia plymuthica]|uniref:Uncharacterized protein n=1 Tax=Serratia plymuthica TaxID=82996 RepID=A0A2X4WTL6_SERPL|nr:Uncharacterised protein [Serratia plymuthica]